MAKVRAQIDSSAAASLLRAPSNGRTVSDASTLVAGIENDLTAADTFSQVRTSLGTGSRALARLGPLHNFLLRALAFVFRDQRNVNAAFAGALRKSLQLNVRVLEECEQLKARLAELEAQQSPKT